MNKNIYKNDEDFRKYTVSEIAEMLGIGKNSHEKGEYHGYYNERYTTTYQYPIELIQWLL